MNRRGRCGRGGVHLELVEREVGSFRNQSEGGVEEVGFI